MALEHALLAHFQEEDEIEYNDNPAPLYTRETHDKLIAPLMEVINTIPSAMRDNDDNVMSWTPMIAEIGGSYPMTIIRFDGIVRLELRLQDDGSEPYVVGKLSKHVEFVPPQQFAIESIVLDPLYPQELERLPELIAKLQQTEVPRFL
jgi:hypothetical protein